MTWITRALSFAQGCPPGWKLTRAASERAGDPRIEGHGVEGHLARLGAHGAELLPRPEGLVDDVPVGRSAQLRAHERPALAGLDVLELEDLEDGPVDLDVVAVLELVGADHRPLSVGRGPQRRRSPAAGRESTC